MYINDSIAQAYILGEDMRCYEKEWFFSGSTVDVDRGKNIFTLPPDDNATRDEVKKLVNRFQYGVEHFEPVNRPVWGALFMDWHTEQLREVYSSCKEKMRAALVETDEKKQEQYLYDAICGKYYEKFACMCGMLYLAGRWEKYGIPGLKIAFTDYHGFAERTLDEKVSNVMLGI